MTTEKIVRERQYPLIQQYKTAPKDAKIIDHARTTGGIETDPFHGTVIPGQQDNDTTLPFGIHKAVGGFHDLANPGDILCGALAACFDSTLRMIADHLGITLTALEVDVSADLDVRGTLLVNKTVPVGFQKIQCRVELQTAEGTEPKLIEKLIAATEHSCVVFQTLQSGVNIETSIVET